MRWHELKEYQTKEGQDITVTRIEDQEGDNNRGWRVDTVEAFVDGQNAGYLKLAYIPHERFASRYPSILAYADQIAGHHLFPYEKNRTDFSIDNLNDDDLKSLVKRSSWIFQSIDLSYGEHADAWAAITRDELLDKVDEITKVVTKKLGKKFQEFKDFQVDKPVIDYIRVSESHQRKGIAFALYREAALWMNEKGLRVYASGLQQPEAAAAWAKMESLGMIENDGDRRFINPSTLRNI
jgi:GNAT superfamily N-acetyltransferase